MRVPSTSEAQNEPNVVPLIDVLLVLIIIFMLAVMKELKEQSAIFASLPQPARPTAHGAPSIVLEVGPRGYRVNQTPVAAQELDRHLRQIYDGRPDKVLFVEGDPAVSYQAVVTAMDIARGAGVRVLGLPPKRSPGQVPSGGSITSRRN